MNPKLALIFTLLFAPSLHAATTSLNLEANTYIRSSSVSSNFSSDSQVIVGTTTNDRLHGLVRFNFDPIHDLLGAGESGSNNFTRFAAGPTGFDLQVTYDVVPEPSTLLPAGLGALLVLLRRRRAC